MPKQAFEIPKFDSEAVYDQARVLFDRIPRHGGSLRLDIAPKDDSPLGDKYRFATLDVTRALGWGGQDQLKVVQSITDKEGRVAEQCALVIQEAKMAAKQSSSQGNKKLAATLHPAVGVTEGFTLRPQLQHFRRGLGTQLPIYPIGHTRPTEQGKWSTDLAISLEELAERFEMPSIDRPGYGTILLHPGKWLNWIQWVLVEIEWKMAQQSRKMTEYGEVNELRHAIALAAAMGRLSPEAVVTLKNLVSKLTADPATLAALRELMKKIPK